MINLFNNISPRNKGKILRMLESHQFTYPKNSKILSNFKNDDYICIVVDGAVQIRKTDYYGNMNVIDTFYENTLCGTILSPLKNSDYDLYTIEDTTLIIIEFDTITNLSEEYNSHYMLQFYKNLLLILSKKINQDNERIEILTNKTIRNRLLAYFKLRSNNSNNSRIIYLPSSFTDLSYFLGIDRCAMSREIRNLKDEGLIEVKGKMIKLLYYDK